MKTKYFSQYCSKYDFLLEHPMRTSSFDPFEYEENNPEYFYKYVIDKNNGYELIHMQKHTNGIEIGLYQREDSDNSVDLKLIPSNIKEVVGNIIFIKRGNGIEINSVYNQPLFKGIIYKLFFDYLLNKYEFIISGGIQSDKGEIFWKKIIQRGLEENKLYKVKVKDINSSKIYDISNIDDMNKYYGDEKFEKYRIVIVKI